MKENIALLIDVDNIGQSYYYSLIEKIEEYKEEQKKQGIESNLTNFIAFGNDCVNKNSIDYVSSYGCKMHHSAAANSGKNSSDISLVISAMTLLFDQKKDISTFIIVSEDKDFLELYHVIREYGKKVIIVTTNPKINAQYIKQFTCWHVKKTGLIPKQLKSEIEKFTHDFFSENKKNYIKAVYYQELLKKNLNINFKSFGHKNTSRFISEFDFIELQTNNIYYIPKTNE